ncbi:MAG: hypothetical protein EAX87_09015 [Candidatus Thorarchaeota archaeon]|nr:hypothetical protein [Candidatus Thorarchaeota archaeon]
MKKSEYDLFESTPDSALVKSGNEQRDEVNVLSSNETEDVDEPMEDIQNYEPTQEMDFKADEIKDCLEKKKKRRNYIEFRSNYEKD